MIDQSYSSGLSEPTDAQSGDEAKGYRGDDQRAVSEGGSDFFAVRNGVECAGSHLIVDVWGADRLDDLDLAERCVRAMVEAANATLLHIHLHHFTPNGGISGVGVLAESHISLHTWPERRYAAFDIFMCGDADTFSTIPVLKHFYAPEEVKVTEHLRGQTER